MLYRFEKGYKAAEAFRDLNELFGEGTIGERQVRRWFERFKSSDISLEDEEGRGRPSDFDDQALLDAVEEDESRTMVDWSTLNISANNRVRLRAQRRYERAQVALGCVEEAVLHQFFMALA
uniref:Mos1 transposase HTH domain-containing protein n=1 Tax=Acrobeloides nanus TaxID=290746 RepID=A0A914E233_9BILA